MSYKNEKNAAKIKKYKKKYKATTLPGKPKGKGRPKMGGRKDTQFIGY
jgi:hypothetical protein